MTSCSIIHTDLHKPNNKLVNAESEHFQCMNEQRANMDSQDSPRPGLGASHHLPLYSIFCAWPRDQHPNVILSWDSQVRISKFLKLGFTQLWRPITLCVDLQLRWGLKQSYIPCWELSNGIWHATYTQGNWGNSWLLMVRSQIGNLIPGPSFGHNLCFNYPNGSWEFILDI